MLDINTIIITILSIGLLYLGYRQAKAIYAMLDNAIRIMAVVLILVAVIVAVI